MVKIKLVLALTAALAGYFTGPPLNLAFKRESPPIQATGRQIKK